MLPVERQNKILTILKNSKMIKLDELHQQIPDVSLSTLRRDIKVLEDKGKIEYLFGGAIRLVSKIGEISFIKKATMHLKEKEKICELASKIIQDQDTIYVDSGSTCTLLLKQIVNRKIIIYTTNTQVCSILGDIVAKVILIGGNYNGFTSSLTGSLTETTLKDLHFDKAFFGISGVNIGTGYMTPSIEESSKKRIISQRSVQSYILCDSSKFGVTSTVSALQLKDATLISDQFNNEIAEGTQIIFPNTFKP
ncbi:MULTISPECIES: DeoR/GlpR family DNA-binding transcription regulator [unclassified Lactobacillus]|uniref:DeoR/GlpR family DNA-binding transcription regulator n=1 Tax=unclassified Lactobacillus TaxID=2620435 RepID=UPI000EFAC475|nr:MULTISPECIES: DeoR/GlpR family DNA-binding transcription regulator [unclassified Lactobacillus]RMC23870.1 DeoR/GlpR transcriptional regulator [Lactobacillus sp. ESL0247]RMC27614.1 DeoR/GlpR transcriptional regulator [Lactobacillus sp. ESL0246]RMC30894.1 DeoR/GlpR transcriptional regulator [Lactobacillus sp. ESL0245]